MADYSSTKAGLISLYEALRQELKHRYTPQPNARNIKTSLVHPSWVQTRLITPILDDLRNTGAKFLSVESVAAKMVQWIENGRSGTLVLPESIGLIKGVRVWPLWLQELLRDRTKGGVRVKGVSLGS
jgi:all-trans-retinol dehydrogenase (NAD+)